MSEQDQTENVSATSSITSESHEPDEGDLTAREDSKISSHEDLGDSSDVKGIVQHHRAKAVVEDRALQAVLAERRRSIEINKSGIVKLLGAQNNRNPVGVCEELSANRDGQSKARQPYPRSRPPSGTKSILEEWHMYPSIALEPVEEEADFLEINDSLEDLSDPYRSYRKRAQPRSEAEVSVFRGRNQLLSLKLHRELQQKRRQMGCGPGNEEMYTDKDRAAAVALGDQDIKISLKNKQLNEGTVMLPDDMDSNIYLMEALKNIRTGKLEIALECANKAVENGLTDAHTLFVRSKCLLLLGRLQEALEDSHQALSKDPNMIKALLVQAEVLYEMGEFERGLVLFHRGNRRRSDISTFQRGIHKSKEAILNAIGSKSFPKKKSVLHSESNQMKIYSSNEVELSKIPRDFLGGTNFSSQRQKKKVDLPKPIMPLIKTSKIASKKLLGGLSSDKEFLTNLLARKSITTRIPLEASKARHRRASVVASVPPSFDTIGSGMDVYATAKDGLASLQQLEAFLWQMDPNELSTSPALKKSGGIISTDKRMGSTFNENQQKRTKN